MEVDELEGELLSRLDSLQTLDKEDLVSQMMRLVGGSGLTKESATFYLEMNAWNVQAAVCAYFDYEASSQAKKTPPQMTFIKDVTIGEGESVPPDTAFTKTWCVQNTGLEPWPEDAILVFTSGTQMAAETKIPIKRALLPYQRMDLSVDMRSPKEAGIYEAKYRMSTASSGIFFGDSIWVIITVSPAGTLALTQQLNNFSAFGAKNTPTNNGTPFGGAPMANPETSNTNIFGRQPPQPPNNDDQEMN